MRLSGFKAGHRQPTMFDRPVMGHGGIRCAVGDLFERLTAAWVGGRRHRTDCRADYCPDVSVGNDFYESKGVGRSRRVFIYGGRLEKDREFSRIMSLTYVVWHHGACSRWLDTVEEIESAILFNLRSIHVVPFAAIADVCSQLAQKPLNSKYGGSDSRPTYGSGFTFSIKLLDPWLRKFSGGFRNVEEVLASRSEQEVRGLKGAPDPVDGEPVPLLRGQEAVGDGVPSQAQAQGELFQYKQAPENQVVGA